MSADTSSTPLVKNRSWEGPPDRDNPDGYPYPDEFVESIAQGELAARCRRALGMAESHLPVYVTEQLVYGGYSEYTQEHDYSITVECGPRSQEFTPGSSEIRTLSRLLCWLDEHAPVGGDA